MTEREEALRNARIANIINALFMASSGQEVFEALNRIDLPHVQAIRAMCTQIIENNEEATE